MKKTYQKSKIKEYILSYEKNIEREIQKYGDLSIFPNFLKGDKHYKVIFAFDAVLIFQFDGVNINKIHFKNSTKKHRDVIAEESPKYGNKEYVIESIEESFYFCAADPKFSIEGEDGIKIDVSPTWERLEVFSHDRLFQLNSLFGQNKAQEYIGSLIIAEKLELPNKEVVADPKIAINRFKEIIDGFELLLSDSTQEESIYQNYLEKNPILLDLYAIDYKIKPKLIYPEDEESVIRKRYVEPDFILIYGGQRYKLIEIERPNKKFNTKQGQQTAQITQATFQLNEWDDYIRQNYSFIKNEYPGIYKDRCYELIVSRYNLHESNLNIENYLKLITSTQAENVHYYTYDSFLQKSKDAYKNLMNLVGK